MNTTPEMMLKIQINLNKRINPASPEVFPNINTHPSKADRKEVPTTIYIGKIRVLQKTQIE